MEDQVREEAMLIQLRDAQQRIRTLTAALDAKDAEIARLREALALIDQWQIPTVFCQRTQMYVPYAHLYGSNGERDYIRKIARQALASITTPATTRTDGADAGHPAEGRM